MSVLQMEEGCARRKGQTPQKATASQATAANITTAPVDNNTNPGNIRYRFRSHSIAYHVYQVFAQESPVSQ